MPNIPVSFSDMKALQNDLIHLYENATQSLPVLPLGVEEQSSTEIYTQIFVEAEIMPRRKTRRLCGLLEAPTLKSVRDMIYIDDTELANRVFCKGEAGHGKTVLCLKLIESWSKLKLSDRSEQGEQLGGSVKSLQEDEGDHLQTSEIEEESDWQSCLSVFDLVFYVPLRHASCGSSSIVDLVCDSMPDKDADGREKVRQMLSNDGIKCLVILDGLDEWRAPPSCRIPGYPDDDGLANCVVFCTMRPWTLINLEVEIDDESDKIIEVCGLKGSCVKKFVGSFLKNLNRAETSPEILRKFCRKIERPVLKAIRRIPLMVSAFSFLWNEEDKDSTNKESHDDHSNDDNDADDDSNDDDGSDDDDDDHHHHRRHYLPPPPHDDDDEEEEEEEDDDEDNDDKDDNPDMLNLKAKEDKGDNDDNVGKRVSNCNDFMTCFYLKLTELMITKAEIKHDSVRSFLQKTQNPVISHNIPSILPKFSHIVDFLDVIMSIGELAFLDLVSEQTLLVFPNDKLFREISPSCLDLSLKSGILCETKTLRLFHQNTSCTFYHKSIQEFMAALYVSCGGDAAINSFREHCKTIEKVMELSNMILFVCGLAPEVGCQLSLHVTEIANTDADVKSYRENEDTEYLKDESPTHYKIANLFKVQYSWFTELKHNLSYTQNTEQKVNFHVSDIYLQYFSTMGEIRMAHELVRNENNRIVSVCITEMDVSRVSTVVRSLPVCRHLTSLTIEELEEKDLESLAKVLPKLVHLQHISFSTEIYNLRGNASYMLPVMRAFRNLTQLRTLELAEVDLKENVPSLTLLETLKLHSVRPFKFILPSLTECTHLKSLYIKSVCSIKDTEVVASVLPSLVHLQCFRYAGSLNERHFNAEIVQALHYLTKLKVIELSNMKVQDKGALILSPQMTQIEEVTLSTVYMSSRQWAEFVDSLLSVEHSVCVSLEDTDIDKETVATIQNSPLFTVSEYEYDEEEMESPSIVFSTVK